MKDKHLKPLDTRSTSVGIQLVSGITAETQWGLPELISVHEVGETIEILYKQKSYYCMPETRVFKIIFSCIDGKWNKSEPIYGKIIPAQEEHYEF